MSRYNITILPGDGIGPEIMTEAVGVLKFIGDKFGVDFTLTEGLVGGASIDENGVPLTDEVLALAMKADAVLLGAVGGPKWEGMDYSIRPERALLALRKDLELFANLRPAKIYPALVNASSLKPEILKGVDIMVVRELTGGIYFGSPRGVEDIGEGQKKGTNTLVYTTNEIERIARVGFNIAAKRSGKLMSIDKANVLECTELWREVVIETAKESPEIELSHMYVDNCAMQLIRNPAQFDVIVTGNMFGDILSDEAAMLTGSIGMLASASIGKGGSIEGLNHENGRAMYEPIHGSAPDIAGQGIANPIAAILSVAMMLKYSFDLEEASVEIEAAVEAVLADGLRTADLYEDGTTKVGCKEMGEAILAKLSA